MKNLKEIRLVYRQHLLPPIVLPFPKISDYRGLIQANHTSALTEEKLNQLSQIHQTVMTQLIKIRNTYVFPLQECPFYYEAVDHLVREKLIKGQSGQKNYFEAASTLHASNRLKIHSSIRSQHVAFRKKIKEKDPNFYKNVLQIPIFKYESPEDIALGLQKDWSCLSQIQKMHMKDRYESQLRKHWRNLNQLAGSSSISIEELIELIKTQMNPSLSSSLKNLLFT